MVSFPSASGPWGSSGIRSPTSSAPICTPTTEFRSNAGDPRLWPIDQDTTVAPGVTAVQTPGHTPGHLCVVVSSAGQRALLLGDAVTCPVQLDEPTWHSIGDAGPELANRTRERLWRELEGEDVTGTGAHFPELRFGRVLQGNGKRWWT